MAHNSKFIDFQVVQKKKNIFWMIVKHLPIANRAFDHLLKQAKQTGCKNLSKSFTSFDKWDLPRKDLLTWRKIPFFNIHFPF